MKVTTGINPNCSETAIRLSKVDYTKVKEEIKKLTAWIDKPSLVPVEDYSSLRPKEDEICLYFYQAGGGAVMSIIESYKIPYDIESPFIDYEFSQDIYEKITEEHYRRKSYSESDDS